MKHKILFSLVLLTTGSFTLTGCDKDEKTVKLSQSVEKKYSQETVLEGVISNDKSIIKTGIVEVTDENGRLINQVTIDNSHFSVKIPINTALPLLLIFSSEGSDEKLLRVHSKTQKPVIQITLRD